MCSLAGRLRHLGEEGSTVDSLWSKPGSGSQQARLMFSQTAICYDETNVFPFLSLEMGGVYVCMRQAGRSMGVQIYGSWWKQDGFETFQLQLLVLPCTRSLDPPAATLPWSSDFPSSRLPLTLQQLCCMWLGYVEQGTARAGALHPAGEVKNKPHRKS